jgi:DNA-binding NarL/FixJ family response regulator
MGPIGSKRLSPTAARRKSGTHGRVPTSHTAIRYSTTSNRSLDVDRLSPNLTSHEVRLLKLLVEGHNYRTAAVELRITASTINFHLQKNYEKLQVHSKTEAVAKALRNGLV